MGSNPHQGECQGKAIGVLWTRDLETILPAQQTSLCFCLLSPSFAINLTKTSRMRMRVFLLEGDAGRQPQTQRTKANFALVFPPITPWPPRALHRLSLRGIRMGQLHAGHRKPSAEKGSFLCSGTNCFPASLATQPT